MDQIVQFFGIRHHGPGSARSLLRALTKMRPDIVLIEGPPEGEAVLQLAGLPGMIPPVALLIYAPENPKNAVFYPFAVFSPEWSAMQYGLSSSIPVRFMDLPIANVLARPSGVDDEENIEPLPHDPLGLLAHAAGYTDTERWWENLVEHRTGDDSIFEAISSAVSALRQEIDNDPPATELQREAYMRQTIRKAKKEGFGKIAVVCGAWHVPALMRLPSAREDSAQLDGLVKVKVAATWVPWTYDRLSYRSGYGAGIELPGWYAHLWETEKNVVAHWMTKVARLLRENDLDASPANTIEAARLAETLAALRDRRVPGLDEMNEAVQTVFSFGSSLPLRLIEDRLIVGNVLGALPPETPRVPLQTDIDRLQKQLRLPPEAFSKGIDLDLRKTTDLERSHLLHRLNLLDIAWGKQEISSGAKGTFHELWRLQWRPELAIAIIEASLWGSTVYDAASARARCLTQKAADLPALTALLHSVLLAELSECIHSLMHRIADESAIAADIGHLMDSLLPLVDIARYGNVRKTDTESVVHVIDGLILRICIGLPAACASLDDEAAEAMHKRIKDVHSAVGRLNVELHQNAWLDLISKLSVPTKFHGLIAGVSCRILLDSGRKSQEEMTQSVGLALSASNDPVHSARWIEGFLEGSGQLLLLDNNLRHIVDEWVCRLSNDEFIVMLPLLRRTFSTFSSPERKQIGERIKQSRSHAPIDLDNDDHIDHIRAEEALPLILGLLGISITPKASG